MFSVLAEKKKSQLSKQYTLAHAAKFPWKLSKRLFQDDFMCSFNLPLFIQNFHKSPKVIKIHKVF